MTTTDKNQDNQNLNQNPETLESQINSVPATSGPMAESNRPDDEINQIKTKVADEESQVIGKDIESPTKSTSDVQSVPQQEIKDDTNTNSSEQSAKTNVNNTNPIENALNQISNFVNETLSGVMPSNQQGQNNQNEKNKKIILFGIVIIVILLVCCILYVLGITVFKSAYDGLFGPYGNKQQDVTQQNANNNNKSEENDNNDDTKITGEDRRVKRDFVKIFSASGDSGTSSSTESFTVKEKKNLKFVGTYKNVSRFGSCVMTVLVKGVTDQTYFSYAQTVEIPKGEKKTHESMVYNVPGGEYYLNVSGYGCEWKVDVYEAK